MNLEEKIKSKKFRVGIIGLGYVGLPLAVELAKAKIDVIGFDVNEKIVVSINKGENHIKDIADDELWMVTQRRRLKATDNFTKLAEVDVVVICVPTPLDKNKQPDMSFIISATDQVAKYLKKDQLVILESTTYPKTTREVILPKLEATGLKVSRDFYLAFAPERVDPGNKKFKFFEIPKVVGGINQVDTKLAKLFYQTIIEKVIPVSSPESAEMTKLLENIFRIVNISMINEFSLICDKMGIDTWEVIEAASTKPYGFMPFYPGPGVGGHCIPLDPFYLSWKAKEYGFYPRFIELSGEINELMPHHSVTKINHALNLNKKPLNSSKILIIGAAYKKDIGDTRESAALKVMEILDHKKAVISYHDPYVPEITISGKKLKSKKLTDELIKNADAVVILTDHSSVNYNNLVEKAKLIVDLRNVIKNHKLKNVYWL